jgi:hypothetical protein
MRNHQGSWNLKLPMLDHVQCLSMSEPFTGQVQDRNAKQEAFPEFLPSLHFAQSEPLLALRRSLEAKSSATVDNCSLCSASGIVLTSSWHSPHISLSHACQLITCTPVPTTAGRRPFATSCATLSSSPPPCPNMTGLTICNIECC